MKVNLKEFTKEEFEALTDKIYELDLAGFKAEALELKKQIPVMLTTANRLKKEMGIEALIATGMNLSEAVKKYGKEWLRA